MLNSIFIKPFLNKFIFYNLYFVLIENNNKKYYNRQHINIYNILKVDATREKSYGNCNKFNMKIDQNCSFIIIQLNTTGNFFFCGYLLNDLENLDIYELTSNKRQPFNSLETNRQFANPSFSVYIRDTQEFFELF